MLYCIALGVSWSEYFIYIRTDVYSQNVLSHRTRLFQACCDDSSEVVEHVLNQEGKEEDRTALVNWKNEVR